jgi:hypothetical protein
LSAERDQDEGLEREKRETDLDEGVREGRLPGVDGAAPSEEPRLYLPVGCGPPSATAAPQERGEGAGSGPRARSTTE